MQHEKWLLCPVCNNKDREIWAPQNNREKAPKLLHLGALIAEAVGFEPTCPGGQPHFETFRILSIIRNLTEIKVMNKKL